MAKTKIEWCDYTINPVKGLCPVACSYCYARRLYDRFKWEPKIRLELDVFQPLRNVKEPSRVFVGSTMELFGDWIKREWMMDILSLCESYKRAGHTFLFLTKRPENLITWSPFPDNAWVGVTATGLQMFNKAMYNLQKIQAKVKYISFEPLLEQTNMHDNWLTLWGKPIVNWFIIGQQTPVSPKTQPKIEWVREIVEAADKARIPVFLKNNLESLIYRQVRDYDITWATDGKYLLRQELPKIATIPQYNSTVER